MGESVGLDLGAATSVAARLRGDAVDPAVLVPTADLGVGATSTLHRLESLAARAVGRDALPAVGVAIPPLEPARQVEIEAAARDAFADPLLVLRPAAAAAWFQHTNDVHPDAHLVVVEADETQVAVTLVRPRAGIPSIERATVGEALSSGAPMLDAIDTVAATLIAAGLVPTDLDVAVIVGGATWLDGLAEGITAATDLAAVVDPEPRAAVAYGAALLAAESDGFGVGTALALGAPTLGAVGAGLAATLPSAAPPLGAGVGEAAGAAGGAGTGLGAALREMGEAKAPPLDPVGAGVGSGAGTSAGGAKAHPDDHPGSRSGPGKSNGRLRRALTVAPAVAVVVVIGAVTVRSCDQSPDTTTLATSGSAAEPDEPSTSDTNSTGGGSTNGSDKPDPLDPTSSKPTTSSTSTTRPTTTTRRPVPTTPGTPAPSTPILPPTDPPPPGDTTAPSVSGLVRSVGDIGSEADCQYPPTTVLSATITDASGVAGATITWSTKSHGGPLTMAPAGGDKWSATLGPIVDPSLTPNDIQPVTWSVIAVDAAGNSSASVLADGRGAVNLHGCFFPDPG
jgi:hypothetical protein